MMLTAVIAGPQKIDYKRLAKPEPGVGEVRVRLEGCGVCSSNLPLWEGRSWFSYPHAPGAPGHEGWGRIDALGPDVRDVGIGDRVAMLSYHAFAEYDIAAAGSVVKLPAALDERVFPGEALGCAMNIFRRSDISAGQNVVIVGIGFLGALLTRLASLAGARVIAISRRKFALDIARQFGAAEIIPMDDHWRIVSMIKDLTCGRGAERVIEAVGEQWPLDLASELTSERGRLIIAGYHQDGPRQVNMKLWNWRGLDVINAHERSAEVYTQGMQRAVESVKKGEIDPGPLYTHIFEFDRLSEALQIVRERPDGFIKAVVIL